MPEQDRDDQSRGGHPKAWEPYFQRLMSSLPPVDPATLSSAEQALKQLSEMAQKVPGSLSTALKTMVGLLQEVTNIKGVEVQLKSFRSLHLKMHILREADIPINKDMVGIGKIESLHLSKLIHLQAEIGEGNKDLRAHIHEGLSLVMSVVFVPGKQTLPLKGMSRIFLDPKGQIMLESTTYLPGTDVPVTFAIPLRQILDEVRKSYKL